jgi:UDP-N-acetylmuramoyl-tripeptide--D-alanyl-D-alanine ligase
MMESLRSFDQISAPNKVVIIGEMMELGAYSIEEHERIASMVMGMNIQERIFVGGGFAMMKNKEGVRYFPNTEELSKWYNAQDWQYTTQLIKGSRSNALERIVR